MMSLSPCVRKKRATSRMNARHKRTKKIQWTRAGAHHVVHIRALRARDAWERKGPDVVLFALGAAT
jgi:hypothetical protein